MVNAFKYARVEEERRFLLRTIPWDLDPVESYVKIFDLYLPGTRLRLRRMESPTGEVRAYKFGQKYRAANHEVHQTAMTNIYLTSAEYKLLAGLKGASLIKKRYTYRNAGNAYGIDVFEGPLSGLVLAEIERHPDQEIEQLPVPDFAIREVTDDPRFTGGELATLTREEFLQWNGESQEGRVGS